MTSLQHVELGVLGPLQVRQYGLPVAIPGAKPRAILTMLGLHGGSVVPADTLLELLWGDDPPRTAVKALQTHISALRRALGDGLVLTEGTGWSLGAAEIDATRYKSAANQGRDAIATGDATAAVARFGEALSLWRGIPELPDGRRGISEKTRWIEGHAALVEDRADALLATGRAAEIIGELEAAIADAPLRERRWGHLMLALYRAGRQGEALGAYQRARSLLADELGVDPGPDLRRLEAAIVTQDVSLELPVSQQLSAITRAVTFLLTDIEGSTAAWEADADSMAIALARHDEIVEQVVTSRGGRLIKTRGEGDATFSVFDRPSGAAAAAIELQEAIRHEPWALAEPMRIRIALHTGEVEFRDGDYFGRAVNRAARLRSLALGGQILCSGATAELVIDSLSDDVVLADLGKRQLKNLARPERVFELRLESADDSRPATPDSPMERPALPAVLASPGPFVGRGLELERLMSAWQTTLAAGTRAVLIAGEPGVGKTRLAGEWSRRSYDEGAVVLYGRCDEDLGAPYQPFAEALRSLVPSLGTNRLRGLRGIEALLALVPGLTDALPDLTTPPRADADTERYALFDVVVALLGVASTSTPVILVLDDLHWAAKPTLLLMRHLLRFGEQARVQIVGTYRSTDLDRSHPLAAMLADLHRDGSADRLTLGGLNENDVTAYVAEAGYDDEELGRALASVTGGNPFFLIEALRHVDESGGKWDPSTLPQGVREAVSRRLSRLPAETNKALAAAAVVGSRFAVDLVERVVEQDLIDAFDEAAKAGILIEEPGGRYRFNHALVRQSLLTELASVRRMRLHQKIAAALESEPDADDELLAELAYHYFECAWAGNAVKAAEYCRRAADQAMSRLAYEGAADLYDKALHALEEIDEDLPDRDDLKAELLIARCEALLAAGDVVSATGAVSQLQSAAGDSVRLAAWGTCFDGQLSMLTDPERLDEIEVAVGGAAKKLATLGDAAGEAKAHTVRAGCLARLGRIGDCETALDQALTAARQAREHRRVNAVLAGAPLAALWGPNPVPRAGGRCLDVVRLLRITTGSPVVEATSTRCQGVLDAFRGRAAAGRQLIDSARRTLTELGMRHALLEVDQFAGIVELVADDPAAAEKHLRRAYKGFRRMGLDADTADTAALLARACLALDKDTEANELCSESERLAGHALKPSIAWRTVRAQLLARNGDHDGAKRVAEEAVAIAERTDELVDHGDACLALATVLGSAGDAAGARAAAERAVSLYELKGAAALAEKVRGLLSIEHPAAAPLPTPEPPTELGNACVAVIEQTHAAFDRGAWDECSQFFAPDISVESRRKVVGFAPEDLRPGEWPRVARHLREGWTWQRNPVVAVRGERLALTRIELGTDDVSTGAPHEEFLALWGLDNDGRIAMQVFFDIDDIDSAVAELDARNVRYEQERALTPMVEPNHACLHAVERLAAAIDCEAWDEVEQTFATTTSVESRRKVVGFPRMDLASSKWRHEIRRYLEDMPLGDYVVIATRDDRLALFRLQTRAEDRSTGAPQDEVLELVGVDDEGRIALQVWFDVENMGAAIAELDAQYVRLARERDLAPAVEPVNSCVRALRKIGAAFDRGSWDEIAAIYAENVVIDNRRKIVGYRQQDLPTGDWPSAIRRLHIAGGAYHMVPVAVHGEHSALVRLEVGTADVSPGAPRDEFLQLSWLDDQGKIASHVFFDIEDMDSAMAELDARHAGLEVSTPRSSLENPATGLWGRLNAHFSSGEWAAIAKLLAPNMIDDDRRHTVNGGIRLGRNIQIANGQAVADTGVDTMKSIVIATRGDRLALCRSSFFVGDQEPGTFYIEFLSVIEIDAGDLLVAHVGFDLDDIDAAFAELDSRYLAGEAAPHAHTWSVITSTFAEFNRDDYANVVNIDHRRAVRYAPGELTTARMKGLMPSLRSYIEVVHRLTDLGVVVTGMSSGTSEEGFEAEWRFVLLLTVDGDQLSWNELFDAADLSAALDRFSELSRPAPRLENAATRADDRAYAFFADGRVDEIGALLSDDHLNEDRRRGLRRESTGRAAAIDNIRAIAAVGGFNCTNTPVALRGDRLCLSHIVFERNETQHNGFRVDTLELTEVNDRGIMTAKIVFDPDELDAAHAELDARYLAGEAAAHAHTWSVITHTYTEFNRHDHDPSSVVNIDHRRVARFEQGDLTPANTKTAAPNMRSYVEAVHRLSDRGAVVTNWSLGTSPEGFDAEWRLVNIQTVDGDRMIRNEMFDEADLDDALARFDAFSAPARPLENAASQVNARFDASFAARDWAAMAAMVAEDMCNDDRRRVVSAGIRRGRDAELANMQAIVDLGVNSVTFHVVAIRGQRLALLQTRFSGRDQRPEAFHTDIVEVLEVNGDNRIARRISFDADDLDAALAELEARYIAGEAAAYAHRWAVITDSYASLNRREIPLTTPNLVNIDHRRVTPFPSGELIPFIHASWEDTPVNRIYVRAVHRLTENGALVASATSATSHDGFDAEWREYCILLFEGNAFSHIEVFDESDLDSALAKFDELNRPATQLDNAANRVLEGYLSHYSARDWDAMAPTLADGFSADDRRPVVNSGTRYGRENEITNLKAMAELGCSNITTAAVATRGERLVLARHSFIAPNWPELDIETVDVVEINADNQIVAEIIYEADDLDAAIAELDARYLAGEGAPYAQVWRVVAGAYVSHNRHEVAATTTDLVSMDHRRVAAFASGEGIEYIRAGWVLGQHISIYIESVHQVTDLGMVFTWAGYGSSHEGFSAEWRGVNLMTVDGELVSRSELFDEADLDAALARFDELSRPATRLENDAVRVSSRIATLFEARDWSAIAELYAADVSGDDRRVIGGGARSGRDAEVANLRAMADLGAPRIGWTVHAIRGRRLALFRNSVSDDDVSAEASFLTIVETNADSRIVGVVGFDPDDFDAAFAELDARYLAGEAAAHVHAWSVVAGAYAAVNRHELPPWTPQTVNIDHRSATAFAPGDLAPYLHATWGQTPDVRVDIVAVHRLSSFGALVTHVATGTTEQGFEGEWREITLSTVEGDRISRSEMFDEADLDAALARFDELQSPATRLENAASRVEERCQAYVAAADWDALAAVLAEDVSIDDRRRVVNAGLRRGRQAVIEDLRVGAEIGLTHIEPTALAIRGERLTLRHIRYWGGDRQPEAGVIELVQIVEIDEHEQISALVLFEVDDLKAAVAELDARFARGEAADHARTWLAIAGSLATFNKRQLPATAPGFVDVDRRRLTSVGEGDLFAYFRAAWELTPNLVTFVEAVHRLSKIGAVVTQVAQGNSDDGFYAEWRVTNVYTVDGDLLKRGELFDEADLDAALARFDELSRPEPRLVNTASRVCERYRATFAARDWDAVTSMLAEDLHNEDRRRVVNAVIRHGRDSALEDLQASTDLGVPYFVATEIALRGERLALFRGGAPYDQRPEAFHVDVLQLAEIDADERISRLITFDADDILAAFEELETRFVAGEAAAHARTWSAIAENCAALNRQQLPAPPDFVYADRRRVANIGAGDVREFFRAAWELTPDLVTSVESVHRLTDGGAVVTQVAQGTSGGGFYAEWRVVNVFIVDGGVLSRCEVFDETELGPAIARFDELSSPAPQLQNAASRMMLQFQDVFRTRNWDAMAEMFAENICLLDRRPVVGVELVGRDATIGNMRASADTGVMNVRPTVVATRGDRIALHRVQINGRDERPEAFRTEAFVVGEVDAEGRIIAFVMFDLEDTNAAFKELDTRYLTGEAAAHAQTYSLIADAFAAVNRHELPTTITPDFVSIDHRRPIAFAPGEMMAYLRATLNDAPEIRIDIETVHRLSSLGVVVSHTWSNTSEQGFDAEWRVITISIVEGGRINRCELFDEADLDDALARFDELSRTTTRLENAASRVYERRNAYFAARDWDALAYTLADDVLSDDRRPVMNTGATRGRDAQMANNRAAAAVGVTTITSTVTATRGERLALCLSRISGHDRGPGAFQLELLGVVEVDADERMVAYIAFELDDIDAAFAELDARYLAGEAADYSRTWSVIANAYAALNRHEIPPTTPDWVTVDHRRGGSAFAPGHLATYIQASWEDSPQNKIHVETVHRLNHRGAVTTGTTRGMSVDGFYAEWREVDVVTVDGQRLNRTELYDEADLDEALARFDELNRQAPRLENEASRVEDRSLACFAARDWTSIANFLADDISFDDRRRVVNAGTRVGRDAAIADARAVAELGGTQITSDVIAIRGEHLFLARSHMSSRDQEPDAFQTESLCVTTMDADGRIAARVVFDSDDLSAAIDELDARYLAGEAAPHADTWRLVAEAFAAMNRREMPATTPDWVTIDRRRLSIIEERFRDEYLSAAVDVAQFGVHVEVVHRLGDASAVVTWQGHWTTPEGFDAEWRGISVLTFDGELVSRCELFDEPDLDTALARFDELCAPAPPLGNVATRARVRIADAFNHRDLDAFLTLHKGPYDDRRKGLRNKGPADREFAHALLFEAPSSWRLKINPIAIRGQRLALSRDEFRDASDADNPVAVEVLTLTLSTDDEFVSYIAVFDPDDIEIAFEELDDRYLAGEAAAYADTWSVIASAYAVLSRRELPATTQDWVNIDHRRGASVAPGEVTAFLRAAWELTPQTNLVVEAVHRLSAIGAVVTHVVSGTSRDGFEAEWREIGFLGVHGELISRLEVFDESDLEVALARFDELNTSVPQLENAATRSYDRIADAFNRRDVGGFLAACDVDARHDDRRKVLRNEGPMNRAFVQGMMSDAPTSWRLETEPIGVRGSHLALSRHTYRDAAEADRPIAVEALVLAEVVDDELLHRSIFFDPDDVDAAFEEMDVRYLAGEAADHAHTWLLITRAFAEFNTHHLPPSAFEWVDHRRLVGSGASDVAETTRAAWDMTRNIRSRIEAVHRLNDRGAVITQSTRGTSQEGFEFELRMIDVFTIDGDALTRCDMFDEADLDAALARFDELNRPARQLDNAARRTGERFVRCFTTGDWDALADTFARDFVLNDRRRVVGAGVRRGREAEIEDLRAFTDIGLKNVAFTVLATRGERLVLSQTSLWAGDSRSDGVHTDMLTLGENDADGRLIAVVLFDVDDIDSAYNELDARYGAGEAAAHAHTWSTITNANAVFNRREMPPTTPDWVNVDHRRGGMAFAPGDQSRYMQATWDVATHVSNRIVAVHRLNDLGVTFTQFVQATSHEGFTGEWRDVVVMSFDGSMIKHCEVFDEDDLDTALSRFDELYSPTPRLENGATRQFDSVAASFNQRDLAGFLRAVTPGARYEDRRKGLRNEGPVDANLVHAMMSEAAEGWRLAIDPIAIRGDRLALSRYTYRDADEADRPIAIEALVLTEVTDDQLADLSIVFDADDINGAFAELTARWIESGEVAHPEVIEAALRVGEPYNRHDWDAIATIEAGATYVNHRQLATVEPETIDDHWRSIRTLATLIPDMRLEQAEILTHSAIGLVSYVPVKGTTAEGTAIELPTVVLILFEGARVVRVEAFDIHQRGLALARFAEFNG